MRALLPLILVLLIPVASAQPTLPPGVLVEPGTGEGIRVLLDGVDIAEADAPRTAIPVDVARPLNVTVRISPPEGVDMWEIRGFTMGLLVAGPDSQPPPQLRRQVPANTSVPANFTVSITRNVSLDEVRNLGAGVFLMQVSVVDANETTLHAQSFYVRVEGNPLLTASGAAVTALSVATGYGLWQVFKDLNELREAYRRHKRRQAEARRRSLDVVDLAEGKAEDLVARTGRPAATLVEIRRAAGEAERSFGPLRWSATGLGLGTVGLAWLQFLGYVAFDAAAFAIRALELAAGGLAVALVGNALLKRWRESARTRTLVPEEGPAPAPGERLLER